MNLKGHVGLTLMLLSLIFTSLGLKSLEYVKIVLFSAAFSSLPDIDIRLGLHHRKYTHNLLFVVITSLMIGYVTYVSLNDFNLGFYSVIASGTIHLLGDSMTYMEFKPLYPLSDRSMALKLFKSNSTLINNLLMASGILAFLTYIKFIINL
ncbi:MAG: metal-dependent hydrolase [Sulfolobales archaeon]|nr:metal-dependent hydrolase [Sulfolobales archaeon]